MLHSHRRRHDSLHEPRILQPDYSLLFGKSPFGQSQHLAESSHKNLRSKIHSCSIFFGYHSNRTGSQKCAFHIRAWWDNEGLWFRLWNIGNGCCWQLLFCQVRWRNGGGVQYWETSKIFGVRGNKYKLLGPLIRNGSAGRRGLSAWSGKGHSKEI